MNLLDQETRKRIIQEINSEENYTRKREQQKRFDIYRERQDRYIIERLNREFSVETVNEMRKVLSINLATKIIDDLSSIYNTPPIREFVSNNELNEKQEMQISNLYDETKFNQAMRRANTYYNLNDQCALMIVPDKRGCLKVKAIPPMHYDVVPDPENPEEALAYILNVWDLDLHKTTEDNGSEPTQLDRYRMNDRQNQKIADNNDREKLLERYIVWTKDYHYVMDGYGDLVGEQMENPIGRIPFVDVAKEKDFQFFVRRGTSVTDFALDVGLLLSDLANVIRLQGYSQAVVSAEKLPENFKVGPNSVLWLKQDPSRPDMKSSFEFVSPSPDLSGSLEFLETTIKLFLSSKGIEAGSVLNSDGGKQFSSGFERMLYLLDKFEATKSDFDLFYDVEIEAFEVLKAWSNYYQDVSENGLKESLRLSMIPEDTALDLKFAEPAMVETKTEQEDRLYKRLEQGLISKKQFLMKVDGLSEEAADQKLKTIAEEDGFDVSTEDIETQNQPDN